MSRRSRDLDLARALARDLARDLDRDLDRDLVSALEGALARAHKLERVVQAATVQEEAPGESRSVPGRLSRGMVALAVRVLPVRDRPRYAEEFRVELGELPRQERWGYALRTLTTAWALRRALTDMVRRPDGKPARRVTEW